MKKTLFSIIIIGVGMLSGIGSSSAAMFSDVSDTHPLSQIVNRLANEGVLIDTENMNLESPVNRDFYTSMVMASSCTPCLAPSASDISMYSDDPGMSDVGIMNSYRYCIAYTLRNRVIPSCTNNTYCPNDIITSTDAIAGLLKHNKKYNPKLQESLFASTKIPESGVLSRGELIQMVQKLRDINQCSYRPGIIVPSSSSGTSITSTGTTLTEIFTVSGALGEKYRWSFGDGIIQESSTSTISHTYARPGSYIVTVYSANETREYSTSISIEVEGIVDSDGDGIYDSKDLCPLVFVPNSKDGCPEIVTRAYGRSIYDLLKGDKTDSPYTLISGLSTNACLARYQLERGLIIGTPVCDTCPCQNRVSILEELRSCDIVFPSILSPDKSLIYSRGSFYQIQ